MNESEFREAERAIRLTIKHVVDKGCDDIFRPPTFSQSLEQSILQENRDDFEKLAFSETLRFLQQANLERNRVGPTFNSLVVKDSKSFRQVSWLDPFDAVKYLALAVLLFDKIENARIPKSLEILHSHRRADEDLILFDGAFGYDSFRAKSGELSRQYEGKWKVLTDISNFFDRIGNHSLENHLLDIGCQKKHVSLLREVLFFWAGDRRSYGVPVGSDASRIVSEVVLIDIDRKLKERGVVFVRYVDDYRIFADTRAEAYQAIQLLTSLLADEGLALNSKKTEVHLILDDEDPRLEPNRFIEAQHEVIDLNKRVEVRKPIRVSGRTQISRFYRQPGRAALTRIQLLDKETLLADFSAASDVEVEDSLKLLIKFFVYVDQDVEILKAAIDRRVTAIFYISDALSKEEDKFDNEKSAEIVQAILEAFAWELAPYPYQVPVLKLFSTDSFRYPDLAASLLDRHRLSDNPIFYRELILLSYRNFNRVSMRGLALDAYPVAPNLVKRAIFFAVTNHPTMSFDEKRPLLRNMKQHAEDWFIDNIRLPERDE